MARRRRAGGRTMWLKQLAQFSTILGLVGALGFTAAPAAQAQSVHVAPPPPHIQQHTATSVAEHITSEHPVQAQDGQTQSHPTRAVAQPQPAPSQVTYALQAAVVPSLAAVFPTVDFAGSPPQFESIGPNAYAVDSPQLVWAPDQAADAQAAAVQLAQHTPGWSTVLLNG